MAESARTRQRRTILVAPLNWGLGHATRCIPIIRALLERECSVVLASDGGALELLQQDFPQLPSISLPGYGIRYPRRIPMSLAMLMQMPRLVACVRREHLLLQQIIREQRIDAVITDNRFGMWSRLVPCVYLTHQIVIKMPRFLAPFESVVSALHRKAIDRFTECWIPDFPGAVNVTAGLTHGVNMPRRAFYVGPLSRFTPQPDALQRFDLLVVISGPEVQRTLFEESVMRQLAMLSVRALVVRGLTGDAPRLEPPVGSSIETVNHMTSGELNRAMAEAKAVLARSGSSTIMDIARMGCKAILVPTPGQTEQEYFAAEFKKKNIYYSEPQDSFDLRRALRKYGEYSGIPPVQDGDRPMIERLDNLLKRLDNATG